MAALGDGGAVVTQRSASRKTGDDIVRTDERAAPRTRLSVLSGEDAQGWNVDEFHSVW